MTGFKPGFSQVLCIVLLLLPRDLTPFEAVAVTPGAVELVLPSGSSEISGLEATRSEFSPVSQVGKALDHRDEPQDDTRKTQGVPRLNSSTSPDGLKLLEMPPQENSGSADSIYAPPTNTESRDNAQTEPVKAKKKQTRSAVEPASAASGSDDAESRDVHVHDEETTPVAAGNAEQQKGYTPHTSSANSYNPDGEHPLSGLQNQPGEVDPGYQSVPYHADYHYTPASDQSQLHYQLHYYDVWVPVTAFQAIRNFVYLPMLKDNIPSVSDQSHAHTGLSTPTYNPDFEENFSHSLPANGQAVGGPSGSRRFPYHKSKSSNFPPRLGKKNYRYDKAASQSRTKNRVDSATDAPNENRLQSSSNLETSGGESSSSAAIGELAQEPEIPVADESDNLAQGSSPRPRDKSTATEAKIKTDAHETLENKMEASEARSSTPEVRHQTTDSLKQASKKSTQASQITSSQLKKNKPKDFKNSERVSKALGPAVNLDTSKANKSVPGENMSSASVPAAESSSHARIFVGEGIAPEGLERDGALEAVERVDQVPSENKLPTHRDPQLQESLRSQGKAATLDAAVTKLNVASSQKTAARPSSNRDHSQPPKKNRFAALEQLNSAVHLSESGDRPGAAEQFDKSENHQKEGREAPDGISNSEQVTTASKKTDDPRMILDSMRSYLKSGANLALGAWYKVPSLRPSVPSFHFPRFTRSELLQKLVEHSPSFPSGKTLWGFLKNSKSKFGNIVGRRIGYHNQPVSLQLKEEPAQAISTAEKKPIKGKDVSKSSGSSPAPSLKSLNSKSRQSPIRPLGEGDPLSSGDSDGRLVLNLGKSVEGESSSSSRKKKNLRFKPNEDELLPDYVKEIKKARFATPPQVELVRLIGKFMRGDSVGSYTPVYLYKEAVHLDKKPVDMDREAAQDIADLQAMEKYMGQLVQKKADVKRPLNWLIDRIGNIEGNRRWKALSRQYNQPRMLIRWKELKGKVTDSRILRVGCALELDHQWPSFYDATSSDLMLLKSAFRDEKLRKDFEAIVGVDELEYRLHTISKMLRRVYPRNWLHSSDLKIAYQQGLDTHLIVIVGDFLQFGRNYLSLGAKPGIPSYRMVHQLFLTIWHNERIPWGTSPEKMWLLSDPKREKLYTDRYQRLKHEWKYDRAEANDVINLTLPLENEMKDFSIVWWNLSDAIEWAEYKMDPLKMAKIGLRLGIPKKRDEEVNLPMLDEILDEDQTIANDVRTTMKDWFKNNANSPYNQPIYDGDVKVEPPPLFSLGRLSEFRDYLAVRLHPIRRSGIVCPLIN
ncbi:hypothetical protein PtA15_10A540 [Puccinia triticina]|uniref:Uncharacterized protein n=1 Tax=Puccinia triticina TaxID=208348 RepID=A0ABY7CV51_9BASI|nr:uncharacterized protein PtA15_10A540 [Puccinia triticina]WAQ89116.1 hypothetical protein PtA15_10A540 [Puccinia triticina]